MEMRHIELSSTLKDTIMAPPSGTVEPAISSNARCAHATFVTYLEYLALTTTIIAAALVEMVDTTLYSSPRLLKTALKRLGLSSLEPSVLPQETP